MKEMVGGCCVCSDERGWAENPLVYCDGQGCTVAVHQACYGIVSVPSGPWFCRKCESQDGSQARVRCELCPSRDGALKRSDGSGWAHVVCALYIPEVRFGNVTTMEPIILQLIPPERFNKTCYICESEGRGGRASVGACMECNKAGCRTQFHVTCAQSLGLLCEEAGNYLDNVKYCGYCQHHYSKLKGGNVKTIPPYKPVALDGEEDKERGGGNKRKPGKQPIASKEEAKSVVVKPMGSKEEPKSVVVKPIAAKEEPKSVLVKPMAAKEENKVAVVKLLPAKEEPKLTPVKEENKFTTSNFTETVVTEGESVFGGEASPGGAGSAKKAVPDASKKAVEAAPLKEAVAGKKEAVAAGNAKKAPAAIDGGKKRRSGAKTPPLPSATESLAERPVKLEVEPDSHGSVVHSNVIASTGIVVSVPLQLATQPGVMATPPTLFQQLQQSMVSAATPSPAPAPGKAQSPAPSPSLGQSEPTKRRRSVSSEKAVVAPARANSKAVRPPATKRASRSNQSPPLMAAPLALKESPPSSPSPSPSLTRQGQPNLGPGGAKGKKKPRTDLKFSGAAHMLGNRLNPASHMSQKLGESLTAELEAHAACAGGGGDHAPLTGPQLHSRVIASVRQAAAASSLATAAAGGTASLAGPLGLGASLAGLGATAVVPQSLDQLLERQWEQGSQFLMEQAQHFDIASLLSCLHQLRAENLRLEEHVNSLLQRRDHLLAVNARLAIPLTTQPAAPPSTTPAAEPRPTRPPYENGLDSVLYPGATANPAPRASQRSNQGFQAAGYQGGASLPGATRREELHPKHS